jgi:hypothetical protein
MGTVRLLAVSAAALMACAAVCGEYRTLEVRGADVALTNDQANSSWALAGVLMRWTWLPQGTVTVSRVSGGVEYVLAAADGSASSNLWWAADGGVYFRQGDAVKVYTGGATGTVQVMQRVGE